MPTEYVTTTACVYATEYAIIQVRTQGLNRAGQAIRQAKRLTLDRIIEWRGKPTGIRVDNGPEYISRKLQTWVSRRGIGLFYIQSGKPQRNTYVERYNRTVRQEWLGEFIWGTVEEVKDHASRWLWTYNNERPNMGIGGIIPAMKLKLAA